MLACNAAEHDLVSSTVLGHRRGCGVGDWCEDGACDGCEAADVASLAYIWINLCRICIPQVNSRYMSVRL